MNINHITISGNLTGPPEMKFLPSGQAVCNFRIANNLKLKDKTKTTFIDVVAWEKTAEVASTYLVKGSPVLLEGRLDLEEWTDRQTQAKRSKHVLTVSRLHLFPATRPAELQGAAEGAQPTPASEIPFGEAGAKDGNPFD